MSEKKAAGGLAGVTAGQTAICTVGKEGALSLIHISEPTRQLMSSRMPSSA